jgi:photoactive yellow protein
MSILQTTDEITTFSNVAAAELLAGMEQLPRGALDTLPFGVIRLDAASNVTYLSRTEALQSGYGDRVALGLKFFTELAPCLGSPDLVRRIEQAQVAGTLDITFEQVGDFDDAERLLLVRMLSAPDGGVWVLLQRPYASRGSPA